MKKIILTFAFCAIFAFAATAVYGAEDEYGHTMTVSAGNGSFESGETVLDATTAEPVTADPEANKILINDEEVIVKPPTEDHFVTGLKFTGHDNSQVLDKKISVSEENEDIDLVVTYGLKSEMVGYSIYYLSAKDGSDLRPSEKHYGVNGSKPVVSFKYVEGYLPNAYNETRTISRGGDNTFYFYYYEVDHNGNPIIIDNNDGDGNADGTAGNNGGGGNANGNANAANPGTAVLGDNAVPTADGPANLVDLDDNEAPLAPGAESDEEKGGLSGFAMGLIGIIIAGILIVLGILYWILKRRRIEEEEE